MPLIQGIFHEKQVFDDELNKNERGLELQPSSSSICFKFLLRLFLNSKS